MARRLDDCPGIIVQLLDPRADVLRVVVTNLRRKADLGAQEGGADLRDQLSRA